jgi:hypothetical protein
MIWRPGKTGGQARLIAPAIGRQFLGRGKWQIVYTTKKTNSLVGVNLIANPCVMLAPVVI